MEDNETNEVAAFTIGTVVGLGLAALALSSLAGWLSAGTLSGPLAAAAAVLKLQGK